MGENPISDAYRKWCIGDESLLRDARRFAFDLTVQQRGFSTRAFSPINADTSNNVMMPFFHLMLLMNDHKRFEVAALRGQIVKCGSPLESAFLWYHLDMLHEPMLKKRVDVEKYLIDSL